MEGAGVGVAAGGVYVEVTGGAEVTGAVWCTTGAGVWCTTGAGLGFGWLAPGTGSGAGVGDAASAEAGATAIAATPRAAQNARLTLWERGTGAPEPRRGQFGLVKGGESTVRTYHNHGTPGFHFGPHPFVPNLLSSFIRVRRPV